LVADNQGTTRGLLADTALEGYKSTTMENDDLVIINPAIAMTARILFTLIFFLSGITHFTDLHGYVNLMPAAIPLRPFWVIISAIVELIGAKLYPFQLSSAVRGMADSPVSYSSHHRSAWHRHDRGSQPGHACGKRLLLSQRLRDDRVRAVRQPIRCETFIVIFCRGLAIGAALLQMARCSFGVCRSSVKNRAATYCEMRAGTV